RAAEPLQLRLNRVFRFPLPGPDALDESLSPELASLDPLLLELSLDDHLRRDARVVGARHPEHPVSLHPLPTGEAVFDGSSVGMSDVQVSGHVGRGNHHHVAWRTGGTLRLKAPLPLPNAVPLFLEGPRLKSLGELPRVRRRPAGTLWDVFRHKKRARAPFLY